MDDIEAFREAQRRTFQNYEDGRNGNFLVLDCGCEIFADPNWNEIALATAIEEHKKDCWK